MSSSQSFQVPTQSSSHTFLLHSPLSLAPEGASPPCLSLINLPSSVRSRRHIRGSSSRQNQTQATQPLCTRAGLRPDIAPPRSVPQPPSIPAIESRSRVRSSSFATTGRLDPGQAYMYVNSGLPSEMSAPHGSPPPYSPTPPTTISVASVPRASSSPHLRHRPTSQCYPSPTSSSSLPSHSLLHSHTPPSYSQVNPRAETSEEEPDDTAPSEDEILYTAPHSNVSSTLRYRLLKRKRSLQAEGPSIRPITTAQGVLGAGETETESEDPPNLPTTRITYPGLSTLASYGLPSWVDPLLFILPRLLSITPAISGTLWNVYHVIWPPGGSGPDALAWRIEYFVSILWSILTGWQCLQLTTGLLKRWRVYYSPLATLIRLFALQAICGPATHLTLTVLNHEKRPALCWAVVGTTTCYSRSIQLWVTSNIGPAPAPAPSPVSSAQRSFRRSVLASATGMREEWMKLRRRRWDWGEVVRKCILPAGVVYFVMAWAELLRKEWERGGR